MPGLPIEKKYNTKYGKISYYKQDGEPNYVFVHGLGGQKDLFSELFNIKESHNKGILCVDLLGYGKSGDIKEKYSFHIQAEALRELFLNLGITKINLVLHSMSSALTPHFLKFNDLEISQIFLLEGNLFEEDADWSHKISIMSDLEYKIYFEKIQKCSYLLLSQQLQSSYPEEQINKWAQCYVNANERAFRETSEELYEVTSNGSIIKTLYNFPGKIVYFRGGKNQDWSGYDKLKELDIDIIKVENAGHYLMLDNPRFVYSKIFE